MTFRTRWALGLVFAAAFAGACSSKSNPQTGTSDDSGIILEDGGSGPMEASICPAVPLSGPSDGGLPACFACIATMCMGDLTTCSTDCSCAPAYQCLEQMSTQPNINTGFSLCPTAIGGIADNNAALTNLNHCAQAMCPAQCAGTAGGD
jgi:hypothetical protein